MNRHDDGLHAANKVAQVTLAFWIIKICATTLGETAGDLLSMTWHIGYALSSLLLAGLLCAVLALQMAARQFQPWLYWSVILATSVTGTTTSDFIDRTLGFGYALGALILLSGLGLVLFIWRRVEGTLSVSDISTRRAELFYWLAILLSNTLGTALGDFLANGAGLGFSGGSALIGGLLALVVLARYLTPISGVYLFWAALVLTRPLGATVGDLLTKPLAAGGLAFGTIAASITLGIAMILGIAFSSRQTPQA